MGISLKNCAHAVRQSLTFSDARRSRHFSAVAATLFLAFSGLALSGCGSTTYRSAERTTASAHDNLTQDFTLSRTTPGAALTQTSSVPQVQFLGQPATANAYQTSDRSRIPTSRQQVNGLSALFQNPFRGWFRDSSNQAVAGTRGGGGGSWSDQGRGNAPTRWQPITHGQLPGWNQDNHLAALQAFSNSCTIIARKPAADRLGRPSYSGQVGQWQQLCAQVPMAAQSAVAAKAFFEGNFTPYFIPGDGKFTGYYEASLNGSRTRHGAYQWPLYRAPADLNTTGSYFDRAQIDAGVLDGRGLELLYIDNPVDIFFLHIQGSGVVHLDDGSMVRVGYAGNNGHQFKGIRPALENNGYDVASLGLTIQAYRNWLMANPQVARQVMNYNPRYIFFDFNDAPAARGDGGVLLTPQRSMAVDKSIVPLHVPLWVTTDVPAPGGQGTVPVAQLMIAQDTGAAIKGEIRGDYYWGPGDEAFARAGRMWGGGRYYVLLPNFIPPAGT